jgi:hypothetical protein
MFGPASPAALVAMRFGQPQLLGPDYFAIAAENNGAVALDVYQMSGSSAAVTLMQVAQIPLTQATKLENVTSYAINANTSLTTPCDATTVSFVNYAYITQSDPTQIRTLYAAAPPRKRGGGGRRRGTACSRA